MVCLYNVLLFMLINSVQSQVLQFGTCPFVETVKYFDIESFVGKWHVIEQFPTWYEYQGECAYKHFQACGRHIEIQHVYVRDGIQYIIHVNSTYTPGDDAIFVINANNADSIGIPLSVVTTDYTNYAVLYGCKLHPILNIKYMIAWILSRELTLPPELLDTAKDTLYSIPYASPAYLEPVRQDETACQYYWTANVDVQYIDVYAKFRNKT